MRKEKDLQMGRDLPLMQIGSRMIRRKTKDFSKARIVFISKRWSAIAKRADAISVVNKVTHKEFVL